MKAERHLLKDFRAEYKKMLLRVRTGEGRVDFPEGTYRLRLLGLRCKGCRLADADRGAAATSAGSAKRVKRVTRVKRAA